nr:uncharacterized protein LOC109182414 [Ipomoea batatas]
MVAVAVSEQSWASSLSPSAVAEQGWWSGRCREEIRSSATELYKGDEICQEKSKFLLKEVGLPNGLLPMKDMEECGYVKDTGFVWLKSKKKTDHKFEQIGRAVQYSTEVTAYVEPGRIKKLTGVKAKELMLWLTLNEIRVDDPPTGKIHFKTTTGLARTFPVSAFQEVPHSQSVLTFGQSGGHSMAAGVDSSPMASQSPSLPPSSSSPTVTTNTYPLPTSEHASS